jgi:hypothetical protein
VDNRPKLLKSAELVPNETELIFERFFPRVVIHEFEVPPGVRLRPATMEPLAGPPVSLRRVGWQDGSQSPGLTHDRSWDQIARSRNVGHISGVRRLV